MRILLRKLLLFATDLVQKLTKEANMLSFFLFIAECNSAPHHLDTIQFSFRSDCAKAQLFSLAKHFQEPRVTYYYAYAYSAMAAPPINQVLNNAHPRSTASMLGV